MAETALAAELDLQQLLARHPDLLAGDQIDPARRDGAWTSRTRRWIREALAVEIRPYAGDDLRALVPRCHGADLRVPHPESSGTRETRQ